MAKQTNRICFYFTGKDGIIYGSVKRDIKNDPPDYLLICLARKRTSDFRGSFLSFVSYVQFIFPVAFLTDCRDVR